MKGVPFRVSSEVFNSAVLRQITVLACLVKKM